VPINKHTLLPPANSFVIDPAVINTRTLFTFVVVGASEREKKRERQRDRERV